VRGDGCSVLHIYITYLSLLSWHNVDMLERARRLGSFELIQAVRIDPTEWVNLPGEAAGGGEGVQVGSNRARDNKQQGRAEQSRAEQSRAEQDE
jgi:hypothetical protein